MGEPSVGRCGHEVLVANPRRTRLIYGEGRKTDKLDAQKLARLARADPELLYPIEHRGKDSQANLSLIHSREALVRSRSQLISHARGTVKSFGSRLPGCSAPSFHKKVREHLPSELAEGLGPIVDTIASLTEKIGDYDRRIEQLATERYPETELLRQVQGIGTLTALTLADPGRSKTVCQESRRRGVPGPGAGQRPIRRQRRTTRDHLRGRQDAQSPVGLEYPLHPRPVLPGLRPQTPRPEDRLPRRQERQKAGGGGGGP